MEKKNKKMILSLILPIYNEENSIGEFIESFYNEFSDNPLYEFIIVDDNSTDKTISIIKPYMEKFPNLKLIQNSENFGRGASFKLGIKHTSGIIVGYMDSDNQIEVENIKRAINLINHGFSMVCGERIENNTKLIRRFFTSSFKIVAKLIRGIPTKDPLCGFKFFKKDILLKLIDKSKEEHWFFDFEIVEIYKKSGLKIADLPIIFSDYDSTHISKTSLIKDSLYYMKKLIFA